MRIKFSLDGIKNMDLLYTWTMGETLGFEGDEEHYHGTGYCKNVIQDIINQLPDFSEVKYLGQRERIANEMFVLQANEKEYRVSFAISTYGRITARIECLIQAAESESKDYDKNLEKLKIALKNILISDWRECTWLLDEQSELLCRDAYQMAYHVENNLRAFVSKVLIHFLGVNWLRCAGFECYEQSVRELEKAFIQRVPEFDDINTDFLSMTLETLVKIMIKGVVYEDEVVLSRDQYNKIQELGNIESKKAIVVSDYIKERRNVNKRIWDDLFVPYIDKPDEFKTAINRFISARNHVAHSKVLTENSYKTICSDFEMFDRRIMLADEKYENEETSDEVIATLIVEDEMRREQEETKENEEAYFRYRLSSETGMDILDESGIIDWFDEVVHDMYDTIYYHYHLDEGFEISDLFSFSDNALSFSVSCLAVDDDRARLSVFTDYTVDSDLGETSICNIICRDADGNDLFCAEISFHNGNGYENEEGLMEADDCTEYDDSAAEEFKESLIEAIDNLNPYPLILKRLEYETKGSEEYVADFPCEHCGKRGVSINSEFLPVGHCCYCGYENELRACFRCGELFYSYDLKNDLCPSCTAYYENQ